MFRKKTDETEASPPEPETAAASGGDDYNPFEGVEIVGGRVELGGAAAANDDLGDGDDGPDDGKSRALIERVIRKWPPERLHKRLVKWLNKQAEKKDIDAWRVPETDEDFRDAAYMVHRRLAGSAIGPVLEWASENDREQLVEDILVAAMGFGPVFIGGAFEMAAKAKARRAAQVSETGLKDDQPTTEEEGIEDHE